MPALVAHLRTCTEGCNSRCTGRDRRRPSSGLASLAGGVPTPLSVPSCDTAPAVLPPPAAPTPSRAAMSPPPRWPRLLFAVGAAASRGLRPPRRGDAVLDPPGLLPPPGLLGLLHVHGSEGHWLISQSAWTPAMRTGMRYMSLLSCCFVQPPLRQRQTVQVCCPTCRRGCPGCCRPGCCALRRGRTHTPPAPPDAAPPPRHSWTSGRQGKHTLISWQQQAHPFIAPLRQPSCM